MIDALPRNRAERDENAYEYNAADKATDRRVVNKNTDANPVPTQEVAAKTPKISLVVIGSGESGDKKSHAFQDNVKQFEMKVKGSKVITIEYSYDETEYDADTRASTHDGFPLKMKHIKATGLEIFFNSNKSDVTIEIIEWS